MHHPRPLVAAIIALVVLAPLTASAQTPSLVRNSLDMELVPITAGSFEMGSDQGYWDQAPAHAVAIARAFLMSVTEVTVAQYRQFRPDADLTESDGLAGGLSYNDAVAFCKWLSEKEGKPYRLPTEAEWEYACRAGTNSLFWSGDAQPPRGAANPWGLRGMHDGVLEWCLDWYGDYPATPQTDPVGAAEGLCRVVRGGGLDGPEPQYCAAASRAGMPPSFGILQQERRAAPLGDPEALQPGLVGRWYGNPDLTRAITGEVLPGLSHDWSNDTVRGGAWSGQWRGVIEAPVTGEVRFTAETDRGARVDVGGQALVEVWDGSERRSGALRMEKGHRYPITVSYSHLSGQAHLRVTWSWDGQEPTPVPDAALWHRVGDEDGLMSGASNASGRHRIGFRVVQAPLPSTAPLPALPFYVQQGVKQGAEGVRSGPDTRVPYFRKRLLLPTPPETSNDLAYQSVIDDAGLHPSFRGHNHCPALVACPNGDLLMVIYTSYGEYEPEVSLIASRLRCGADEWDMPSRFVDCPGANDHAPLLWNDSGRLYLFWGNPRLIGGFPFQWITSTDSGATWSEVRFPRFPEPVGTHSRQPINSAFRAADGTLHLASDGGGGDSVLWASHDDGQTWSDPGGRTFGRHTTFALLRDGRILGMGGKNTDIDGYMPRSVSADGGRTWERGKTPFPALGANQRPSILRLQSGRLFFAGDYQRQGGVKPAGVAESGSYVALSDDEGETWRVRPLGAAEPHENPGFLAGAGTIGYSAACQTPDGLIHLITTMNRPCLHFTMNEAWILTDETGTEDGDDPAARTADAISAVRTYRDAYPDGATRTIWEAGLAADGRYVLNGRETWQYPDGRRQFEATYRLGREVGTETYWGPDGTRLWEWQHNDDGTSLWTQWWENGQTKAESRWRSFRAEGLARRWDRDGRLISERTFAR